jgi:hypothetical protein
VTIAGIDDKPVNGKKGYGPLEVDSIVDLMSADGFDALVIPGGFAADKPRRSPISDPRSPIPDPRSPIPDPQCPVAGQVCDRR